MANSILSSLSPAFSSGVNGFLSHLDEFNNFKNNFTGNPQVEAQKLLQSGQMSQQQFQQYAQLANLIRPLIGR